MKSLFVGITFFSTLSFWNAFIPLILQSRGVTLPEVFFARSFYFIAKAILELPTGLLADRIERRHALTISVAAICLYDFGMLWFSGLPQYLLLAALGAFGTTLSTGADSALSFEWLTARKREAEYSKLESARWSVRYIAIGLAPVLGGWMLLRQGADFAIKSTLVADALALLMCISLPIAPSASTGRRRSGLVERISSVLAAIPWRFIALPVGAFAVSELLMFCLPIFGRKAGIPTNLLGLLIASIALSGAFGSWIAGHLTHLKRAEYMIVSVGVVGMTWIGGVWIVHGLTAEALALMLPGLFLVGAVRGSVSPLTRTWIIPFCPGDSRATIMSGISLLAYLAFASGMGVLGCFVGFGD